MRIWCLGLVLPLAACAALSDELNRAEENYEQARYDNAAVWLADLEDSTPDLDRHEKARYHFLRGMTAYRLGERDEALYYLSLTKELVADDEGSLRAEWRQSMDRVLEELTPKDASHRARAGASEAGAEEASK